MPRRPALAVPIVRYTIIAFRATGAREGIAKEVGRILSGLEQLLGSPQGTLTDAPIEIDDRFVGDGYGVPTAASTEAIELCARREVLFLDPTYTAKAMAGLFAKVRGNELGEGTTLFWHTGGQVALFAEC